MNLSVTKPEKNNKSKFPAFVKYITYNFIAWFAAVNQVAIENNIFVSRESACSNFTWTLLNFDFLKVLINCLKQE